MDLEPQAWSIIIQTSDNTPCNVKYCLPCLLKLYFLTSSSQGVDVSLPPCPRSLQPVRFLRMGQCYQRHHADEGAGPQRQLPDSYAEGREEVQMEIVRIMRE